jgi:hypothetical protein
MVRAVVPVVPADRFGRSIEELGRFLDADAVHHRPGDRRMFQNMRGDALQPSALSGTLDAALDAVQPLPAEHDDMRIPRVAPAAKVHSETPDSLVSEDVVEFVAALTV